MLWPSLKTFYTVTVRLNYDGCIRDECLPIVTRHNLKRNTQSRSLNATHPLFRWFFLVYNPYYEHFLQYTFIPLSLFHTHLDYEIENVDCHSTHFAFVYFVAFQWELISVLYVFIRSTHCITTKIIANNSNEQKKNPLHYRNDQATVKSL